MDGELGPQETQFICPLLMESIKRINSTEMNPVGELANSNNFYVEDENDTRIVRNMLIKDAKDWPFWEIYIPLLIRNEYCVTFQRIFGNTSTTYNKVWILGEIKTDIWLKNKADYLLRR